MNRLYQYTAVICIFFAAFVAYKSLRLRYYTSMGPGPGFFPLWLAILFALLAVVIFCQATFGASHPLPKDFFATRAGYFRIGAILLSLLGTVALLNPLGFRLTTLGFYVFLLTVLGRHRLIVAVLIALVGSFGVYHVFANMLMIPLPVGMFGL